MPDVQKIPVGEAVLPNRFTSPLWLGWFNSIFSAINSKPDLSYGDGTPSTTPTKIGSLYIDTTNVKLYAAKGTTSSSDWFAVN